MSKKMSKELTKVINKYFDDLERNNGGECNDVHNFQEAVIGIIENHENLKKDEKLITKLADNVWAVAKKLEVSNEERELKMISSCLHDIRAGHKTKWYEKFKIKSDDI